MADRTFEKNMEALGRRYPDLAKKIESTPANPSYKLIRTANDQINLLIKRDADYFMLYDNDDPVGYCDNYLEQIDIKYAPIVVFLGMGLGYHLDRYFKRIGKEAGTREIVVIEKAPELFRFALGMADFTPLIEQANIHFFVGEEPADTYIRLKTEILSKRDSIIAIKSLKVIPLPVNVMLEKEYYQNVFAALKNAARQLMVINGNDSLDSFVGLENIMQNIGYINSNPGINTLYGKFAGRPGVLVAAGPSLNKNIHLLRGLRDKALIISCDASFVPLMTKGIRPHLVSSLERTPGVDLFFSNIKDFAGVYFIALPILMPETIDSFTGKKFIAYRDFSHFGWLEEDKGSLAVGISVANLAFQILVKLACDPIILIGQDLAYADDGDTHVKGNIFGSRDKETCSRPVVELEGNDGRPVKSQHMWVVMKNTYEEEIAFYPGTCVNATEGGAKIRGTVVMPFKDAIDKYCRESFRPDKILDREYSSFVQNFDPESGRRRLMGKLRDNRQLLDDSIEKFCQALEMTISAEREIIEPFLDGVTEDVNMERLVAVERKFLQLSDAFGENKAVWDLMAHTLNAYDTCFSNELGFLRDIYRDETCLAMARVKKIKDWFSVVGMFFTLTRDLLSKTEKRLGEGIVLSA